MREESWYNYPCSDFTPELLICKEIKFIYGGNDPCPLLWRTRPTSSASGTSWTLRGKTKVTYTPNADCGDNVIIINAGQAVLTGKKPEQKIYRTHSGWIGGLKETKYRILMQEKPELAMRVAVRGMMPRNTVTKDSLKRLHIYAGEAHEQQAQKPEVWEVK